LKDDGVPPWADFGRASFEARCASTSEHVNLFAIHEIAVAAGVCIVIP
jgi:hypothetical protein